MVIWTLKPSESARPQKNTDKMEPQSQGQGHKAVNIYVINWNVTQPFP